jgi:hypothetical protein
LNNLVKAYGDLVVTSGGGSTFFDEERLETSDSWEQFSVAAMAITVISSFDDGCTSRFLTRVSSLENFEHAPEALLACKGLEFASTN